MAREAENFIPSFMESDEYEQRRRTRLQQIEEEEYRLRLEAERRCKYKLQKQAEIRRMREKKRRQAIAVRIVVAGLVVTVFGSVFVNALIQKNAIEPTNEPYEVIMIGDTVKIEPDNGVEAIIQPTVESEPEYKVNIDLSFEARKTSINPNGRFEVGSEVNEYFFMVLNSNKTAYDLFLKYGEMYGVDPYILMAKAFQESSFNHNACLPGGKNYNGYGVGIMQHESPDSRQIVAHNYITGQDDVMYLTMENAVDLETNIKMGAMHFQKCLEDNNGNILLALQSYNYGQGMINSILNRYAKEKGLSVDAVKQSYSDTGWLNLVTDAHNNAWRYVRGWEGYYGDDDYIEHVLRYFIGSDTYYYYNGEKIIFDLNTFEMIKVDDTVRVIS